MKSKNKIKLSLIDDYIKIVAINNFFNNEFKLNNFFICCAEMFNNTQQLDKLLKKTYEILFDKLHLNNTSLEVLKKDLINNNSLFMAVEQKKYSNLKEMLLNFENDLNIILNNLKFKTKALKINL